MMPSIRSLAGSTPLITTVVAGALVLALAAPRPRPARVVHPLGCRVCAVSSPPAVLAAREAQLVRLGAIEPAADE